MYTYREREGERRQNAVLYYDKHYLLVSSSVCSSLSSSYVLFNFEKFSVLFYGVFLCSPDNNYGFSIILQHIDKIMSTHGKQIMQAVTLILEGEHNIEVKEQVCVPPPPFIFP